MESKELFLGHFQNLHDKLGLRWYADTEADVAAIFNLMHFEIKESVKQEVLAELDAIYKASVVKAG